MFSLFRFDLIQDCNILNFSMFLVLWLASWGSSRILFSSLDLRPFLLLITVVGIEVVEEVVAEVGIGPVEALDCTPAGFAERELKRNR